MKRSEKPYGVPSSLRPRISITVSGPRVGEARLSANDFASIVHRCQQAIQRIGQVLYGESSIGKGRKKRDIEELCELFVVAWKPGSAVAEVELAEPPNQLHLFGHIGEESMKAFLNGLRGLRADSVDLNQGLPPGFDSGVLQTCNALSLVLDHGIDSVRFAPVRDPGVQSAVIDRPLREKVQRLLGTPLDQRQAEKVGRLEVLDGHNGLAGRLWEADGTRWMCIFKPEHLEILPEFWLHNVRVIGEAIIEANRERILKVDSILPLEDEIGGPEPPEAPEIFPFLGTLSLEELAVRQGVESADDLDAIAALWPADDDPDDLLRYIQESRAARREIARGDGR